MAAVIPVRVSNAQLKAINPVDFVRVHLLFIGLGNFKSRAGLGGNLYGFTLPSYRCK
jgi:hypothetical protein